ncbi:hypothetical protein AB0M95_40050 [Sphaerisporangium sp. NPDC051017]|uniref:hypothetical protein n=1 Tax=Sphaerisporangium sp. NPDC051017 TaxID=3154636 RepID=UPI003442383B
MRALEIGGQTVPVSELFYSFQGEGMNRGRRALFVRLMQCNLTCGYATPPGRGDMTIRGKMLCDTEYTWNTAKPGFGDGARQLMPVQVWEELLGLDPATNNPGLTVNDLVIEQGDAHVIERVLV